MSKRYALVGVWVVFAAAAIGVGFAAAGLVDAPFGQRAAGSGLRGVAAGGPDAQVSGTGTTSPSATATTSAAPRGSKAGGSHQGGGGNGGRTATPTPGSASASTGGSSHSGSGGATPAAGGQVRGITTRGGWVQGRCSGGLVSLSASPAVGWALDGRSSGANSSGEVRFEESGGAGEVRVTATCAAGAPRFSVREDERGGQGGGDGGGDGSGTSGGEG